MDLDSIQNSTSPKIDLVFEPSEQCCVEEASAFGDEIMVRILNNVNGEIYHCYRDKQWQSVKLDFPKEGAFDFVDSGSNLCYFTHQHFLTPKTTYAYDLKSKKIEKIKSNPSMFDASNMVIHQYWATSNDGTQVPYYAIHAKSLTYQGNNPTLLYGYGGFGDCQTPYYLSKGKQWLSKGGIYLFANIRGGGEFGPHWHQAAQREKRPKSFEDFIAVANDAIQRGLTSPNYLGIHGASNGGLLVAVAFTQHPELFKAVICDVPLLDMVNYAGQELGGERWLDEYGDPRDPKVLEVLKSYSPYHNVSPDKQYPEVLFLSSTADDRVHPGHARKMVYRMTQQKHKVFYYESKEGGHHGITNLAKDSFIKALKENYLHKKLMPPKSAYSNEPSARDLRAARRNQFFQPANTSPSKKRSLEEPEKPRKRIRL